MKEKEHFLAGIVNTTASVFALLVESIPIFVFVIMVIANLLSFEKMGGALSEKILSGSLIWSGSVIVLFILPTFVFGLMAFIFFVKVRVHIKNNTKNVLRVERVQLIFSVLQTIVYAIYRILHLIIYAISFFKVLSTFFSNTPEVQNMIFIALMIFSAIDIIVFVVLIIMIIGLVCQIRIVRLGYKKGM